MAKVPPSFATFQALLAESSFISEVGEAPVSGESVTKEKSLSFLCDNVLASLHGEEQFRDAIVDSRANIPDNSILLLVNAEFEQKDKIMQFISALEHVSAVGIGERQDPVTKEKMIVIKIKGKGSDCNPTKDNSQNKNTSVSNPVST